MTDNEIIKALECCAKLTCSECPYYEKKHIHCRELRKLALDLINRQKAEIERLKFRKCLYSGLYSEYDIKQIRDCTQGECFHRESEELVRIEAIKEFAKKINPIIDELVDIMFDGNESKCRISNCHKHSSIPCDSPTCIEENKAYWKLKIYNLVKEMVGDDNA